MDFNAQKVVYNNGKPRRALDLRGAVASRPPQAIDWSFKVSRLGSGLVVGKGYRCVVDSAWELVEDTDLPSASGDGVVYMTRVYPILNAQKEIQTPGYWQGPLFGSPPANDETRHTIRIASVNDGELMHEHMGNISVIDWGNC